MKEMYEKLMAEGKTAEEAIARLDEIMKILEDSRNNTWDLNELIDEGEIDFKANAHRLAEKKLFEDFSEEDLKKLLYKNGFNV